MLNPIYTHTVTALSELLNSSPQDLVSGNGCRFVNARRGKVTVYHSNIAGGNRAEIAFQVDTFSERLGLSGQELSAYFSKIGSVTGRNTNPDPQWKWPRVGISSNTEVDLVIGHLRQCYTA